MTSQLLFRNTRIQTLMIRSNNPKTSKLRETWNKETHNHEGKHHKQKSVEFLHKSEVETKRTSRTHKTQNEPKDF